MGDKFETYEELCEFLEKLPVTWYPDLIRILIHTSIRKGVFIKGKVAMYCSKVEKGFKQ